MPMPSLSRRRTLLAGPPRSGRGAMTPAHEIERVVAGEHPDPHSVLGAHPGEGGIVVRAFRPGAASVRVLPQKGEPVELARVHEAGVFEGVLPRRRTLPRYRLEVGYPAARPVVLRDPYSFLPTLGELDLHLIAEGRHERLWDALGAHVRDDRRERRAPRSRCGRQRARGQRRRRLQPWDERPHPMRTLGATGVWELFVPEVGAGARYKFEIRGADGVAAAQGRPVRVRAELPPRTASVVHRAAPRVGRRRRGSSAARAPSRTPGRCRSTRCTSARGGGTRSRATAR